MDLYGKLGLDRDLSAEELRNRIEQSRLQWRRRAALAGKCGDEGRQMLQLLDRASEIFADEDSKERYDRELRTRGSAEDEASINWVNRAWSYLFHKDLGAASIAARKARQRNSDDPMAYVVSAWIELTEGEYRKAEEYASEAYVLDEFHQDSFDVHYVRGVALYCVGKYDRAVEALQRALTRASDELKPETCWRLSVSWHELENYDEGLNAALRALEKEEYLIVDDLQSKVLRAAYVNIEDKCIKGKDCLQQKSSLNRTRGVIEGSDAFDGAKRHLLGLIDKLVERVDLEEKVRQAPTPLTAEGGAGCPIAALGAAGFFFLLFLVVPHGITLLLFAVPAGWVGRHLYLRKQYKELEEEYRYEMKRYQSDARRKQVLDEEIKEILSGK